MLTIDVDVKLDKKILDAIAAGLEEASKDEIQVGWFGGKIHPDYQEHLGGNGGPSTIAGVALMNEFGVEQSGLVPRRSFIRPTLDKQRNTIIRRLRLASVAVLTGKTKLKDTHLRGVGRDLQKAIKTAIFAGDFDGRRHNGPATIEHKGFDAPLIGKTGLMRTTVEYRKVIRKR